MKLTTLLFLSASLAVGHVLPGPKKSLAGRADQTLTNPDNDPDYEDHTTGNKTPKSRVLSGVGPQAADDRWFDWDESCSDKDQRAKIVTAFEQITQLSDWTSKHLEQLKAGLPKAVGSSVNAENRKYIFEMDPAFAQMFLGQDNRIQYIKETFDLVTTNAKKPPGERGGNKPGALRFICSAKNEVKDVDGQPYCGPTIEPKYSFEQSSSITFCPAFFNNLEFPTIDAVVGSGQHTLDKVDCAERILMHEYMHLPWIRNMPGHSARSPDHIGYFKVADYARAAGWGPIKVNPDNYTWLALYAYFNNNNEGCGTDVWPSGEAKPNKL
ncbi:hypothetical protein AK830_g10358 [Neonectria ditissima]|uniref:Lysine-specific metallo-endopeptidase domain-containing protein n=1 Tax=Neonectria ditissima TaxID=78410 RepID=A0A0P7AQ76_9HYPO|nr:hypothetical protein AK830_g10358 [Neonectria ditissima]